MRVTIRFKLLGSFLLVLLFLIAISGVAIYEMTQLGHLIGTASSPQAVQGAMQQYQNARTIVIVLCVVGILVTAALVFAMSALIASPILKLSGKMGEFMKGDMTLAPLQIRNKDELGSLVENFNRLVGGLHRILSQVVNSAHQMAASSEQLTASSEHTSQAAQSIADSVQSVAIGAENQLTMSQEMQLVAKEISESMSRMTDTIEEVTNSTVAASSKADTGQQMIGKVIDQMGRINERVRDSADVVNKLGNKSNEIGEIIALITSIAAQTNLLALNAAIEAARAGEQGRGFAVVADEVRKLAEQSGSAAEQVRTLIGEIQSYTAGAITAMDHGTAEVHEGMELVNQAGYAFEEILQAVDLVAEQTQGVSANMQQVNAGTMLMADSMSEVAVISEQSASNTQTVSGAIEETNASMQEITASASMLSKMADELLDSLKIVKL